MISNPVNEIFRDLKQNLIEIDFNLKILCKRKHKKKLKYNFFHD